MMIPLFCVVFCHPSIPCYLRRPPGSTLTFLLDVVLDLSRSIVSSSLNMLYRIFRCIQRMNCGGHTDLGDEATNPILKVELDRQTKITDSIVKPK